LLECEKLATLSPLEIGDAHLALSDVGTHADHLQGRGDAVESLATLIAWDEVLDVVEAVELVAHLLFNLGTDGCKVVGEDDIFGFDELLSAIDGSIECLDIFLLAGVTEGKSFLIIFKCIDEDEAVEGSFLLIEAKTATDLREFELRLVGPKDNAAFFWFGLDEQIEEVAVIAVIAEVAQMILVVEGTYGRHAWAGLAIVVVEELADMGLRHIGDLDAEQVGGTEVDEQGGTRIAQVGHLHTADEDLLAERGAVHRL